MNIDWQKVAGLLPAIVQENSSNEVLMLAYMNEEALNLSLKTGYAHYFSRTKNRIWKKGEESGNTQKIHSIKLDCDSDTLLLSVTQNGGVACHTGEKSCFFKEIFDQNMVRNSTDVKQPKYDVFDELYHIIMNRKLNANPENSYVAALFKKGENQILKKVAEECGEFIMACKEASFIGQLNNLSKQKIDEILINLNIDANKNDVVYEAADVLFHMMCALALHGLHIDSVKNELERRFGISGIEEKNQRDAK